MLNLTDFANLVFLLRNGFIFYIVIIIIEKVRIEAEDVFLLLEQHNWLAVVWQAQV